MSTAKYAQRSFSEGGLLMFYVYILKSIKYDQIYIGQTDDLKRRIEEHNSGKSFHTKKYAPWEIKSYFEKKKKTTAVGFEKYLKTGSGKAFLRKRLL
mgnify:FL=1